MASLDPRKPRILVADDEPNIRLLVDQALGVEGYEVVTAVDGEHALKKFSDGVFDLVLLDLKMPGLDGMEALRRVKKRKPGQPVIVMTAFATVETAASAMRLGAVDYLQKPFTPEEIRAIVKSVLTRSRLVAKPAEKVDTFEDALGMAKNAITQHDWTKAPEYLKRACALNPTRAEPFNLLGVVFELAGDIAEAQRMYEAALALDESYEPAQFNLNRTLERARRDHDFKLESEPSENA